MFRNLVNSSVLKQILTLIQPKFIRMTKIERAFVRSVDTEHSIQISFKYSISELSKSRAFNFTRPKTEELEKSLLRISGNVSKEVNKRSGKKKSKGSEKNSVDENLLTVELLDAQEQPVNKLALNDQAWSEGATLTIGNIRYSVELNAPTVMSIYLPTVILSGFPVRPKLNLEFVNEDDCQMTWFVSKTKEVVENDSGKLSLAKNWDEVGKTKYYVPSKEHVGYYLKVTFVPKNGERSGEEMESISKEVITEGPTCPFEKRHAFTPLISDPNSFRVISYNILANLYADSDYSREVLFPYCPPEYLHMDYRKNLIIRELVGYNADVICLQEVDKKIFQYDLVPMMRNVGFEGVLKLKMENVAEGSATFYRSSKFRLVETYDVGLTEFLSGKSRSMRDLLEKISDKEPLLKRIMSRWTTIQVSLLQDIESERYLLVATTHLYFHPEAAHIRIIQTHICITYLQELLKKLRGEKCIEPSLIYCGDFNASMTTAVHEYLLGGSIPPTHPDLISGGLEEHISNLHLSHDLRLSNSSGFPQYTNFANGFSACLDYIYTSGLSCSSVIPMPSHADVVAHVALPNQYFPSDHISIGCDLKWTSEI